MEAEAAAEELMAKHREVPVNVGSVLLVSVICDPRLLRPTAIAAVQPLPLSNSKETSLCVVDVSEAPAPLAH